MLWFASDYMEGAHPSILEKLLETNLCHTAGYGGDEYSQAAREKIRAACQCPDAEIHFLAGGTQANAVVIAAMLAPYQGVIAPETGHINVHEAGAIEAGGHKVLSLPQQNGKLRAEDIGQCAGAYAGDANRDHIVMPGMVYISQPTEYGTIYSLEELEDISRTCRRYGLKLFLDGARLAYALACRENTASLADIARLCDVFYIGGTKCGALFGEAVVFPKPGTVPHFFSIVKQMGALLAKGRIAGIQFDVLFADGLYRKIGKAAVEQADRIRAALREKGYQLYCEGPTNQVFFEIGNDKLRRLSDSVQMSFMEALPGNRSVMRFATSWATDEKDVDRLIALL